MIYMKSTSGADGSYTLNVTFALGTDPDINTVNVKNRVRSRRAAVAARTSAPGRRPSRKNPSALLQVIPLYSPKQTYDELYLNNYATINVLDEVKRIPGVGDASLFGPLDYSHAGLARPERLTGLDLTPTDVIERDQEQNVQAAVGRIGARPTANDQQLQLNDHRPRAG